MNKLNNDARRNPEITVSVCGPSPDEKPTPGIPAILMVGMVDLLLKQTQLSGRHISDGMFNDLFRALLPVYQDLVDGKYAIRRNHERNGHGLDFIHK